MTHDFQASSEYFAALARLRVDRPMILAKGTRITKDAVALEAGRKKGSIKKSRSSFAALILSIEEAAAEQSLKPAINQQMIQLVKAKGRAQQFREELDNANSSLISRIYEIHELKKKIRTLQAEVERLKTQTDPQARAKLLAIKPRST